MFGSANTNVFTQVGGASSMVTVNIDDIGFNYSGTPVLKGISMEFGGPQLISILGPNGVGKSTFIHCLNKILVPSGSVLIDGSDVSEMSLKEVAKEIGYVPYTSNDTFPLTVMDTVLLGRHPHASWKMTDADLEKVQTVLEKLGINDLAMRYTDELSAGQHQKVMLARGLVQEPKILMLDEPTSNLDVRHQLGITRYLRRLTREEGLTVVMISHDLNIAAKYSDSVVMMKGGGLFAIGTPEDTITEENIFSVYGVHSHVITDEGRPHVILRDPENMDCPLLIEEHYCVRKGRFHEWIFSGAQCLWHVYCQKIRVHSRLRGPFNHWGGVDLCGRNT